MAYSSILGADRAPVQPSGRDAELLGPSDSSDSGSDALGRHAYAVGGAWSTAGNPDWYAAYAYDRWRPTLFASYSDDTDPIHEYPFAMLALARDI